MFLLTLVLWLPFSFKTTGLVEEWGVLRVIDSGSQLFFITPNSPLGPHRMRPLEVFVHALARMLDPNSFLFFNVFQCLFMFGKMAAVSWLVLQFFPGRRLLAFAAGVLFLVYPADRALFTFRAIHIHAAVCSYLVAACLFIRFVKRPARGSTASLIGAGLLLMFSLMTYQIALPLAVLTPLAALAFLRISDRRLWTASAVWYAAVALPMIYAAWALRQGTGTSYELGLVSSPATTDVLSAIRLAYERQLTGWSNAWRQLPRYPPLRADVAIGVGAFLATAVWIARREGRETAAPSSARRDALALVVALAIVLLGMAMFLAIPTHRRQDFRIYFMSMAGSALALSLVLFWISRAARGFQNAAFLVLTVPFVALGYTFALQDHQYFVNYSLIQQQLLQDLAAAAPRLTPGSYVIFLDRNESFEDEYVFDYGSYLDAAVDYLYDNRQIGAKICPLASPGALGTTCTFDATSIHIKQTAYGPAGETTVPYDRVVFLANGADERFRLVSQAGLAADHDVSGYNPDARIAGPASSRLTSMFSCEPAMACYRESTAAASSFELPYTGPIGKGWRASEPDVGGGTFRWSVTVSPTVSVHLASDRDLALEFRISAWLEPDVVDSLTLTLNGVAIPLSYEPGKPSGRLYRGVLPRDVLKRSAASTQLVFSTNRLVPVPSAPDIRLGVGLSSLRIYPR